jgi:hypothetical protein
MAGHQMLVDPAIPASLEQSFEGRCILAHEPAIGRRHVGHAARQDGDLGQDLERLLRQKLGQDAVHRAVAAVDDQKLDSGRGHGSQGRAEALLGHEPVVQDLRGLLSITASSATIPRRLPSLFGLLSTPTRITSARSSAGARP